MTDTRLQVDLDRDTLSVLDALMVQVRLNEGNRKIGAGTIASRLMKSLTLHPDMIEQLLEEYSARVQADGVAVAAEPRETYQALPKSKSRRAAK